MKMVAVSFRAENERLVSMFTKTFKTVKDAKKMIEEDAKFYCSKHPKSINVGWIHPNDEDYYMVTNEDFVNVIWQYFEF